MFTVLRHRRVAVIGAFLCWAIGVDGASATHPDIFF